MAAKLGRGVHLLGHGEQWRGNATQVPTPRGEISASPEHAVGCVFKWACLLTLVGVARVPALMKTTKEQECKKKKERRREWTSDSGGGACVI